MKRIIALLFISGYFTLLAGGEASESSKNLNSQYPNRMITSDFGIITADDLAHDVEMRDATPYDPTKTLFARYWQCLPVKDVMPKYRTWLGEDGMDRWDVVKKMCDLEIHVHQSDGLQIYGDRRAHPNEYCQKFSRDWRRLTMGQKIVCLNGDNGNFETDKINGKYKAWTWNKIKTRKGCFSYLGECNVRGCAEGRCPK